MTSRKEKNRKKGKASDQLSFYLFGASNLYFLCGMMGRIRNIAG
jgi:hypothetical protein